jgi:hypothetical protein
MRNGTYLMRTPLRFSAFVAAGILIVTAIASLVKPPDLLNGQVIPWDVLLRIATSFFIALLGFLGTFLAARRPANPTYLSAARGLVIVALCVASSLIPLTRFGVPPTTITTDKVGRILQASSSFYWSPLLPLLVPYVVTFVVTHLPFRMPGRTA